MDHIRPGSSERTRRIRSAIDGVGADVWVLTETHSRFSPGNHVEEISRSSLAAGQNRHIVVFGTVLAWRGDRSTELRGAAKFEQSLAAQSSDWDGLLGIDDDLCVIGDFNQELSADGRRWRASIDHVVVSNRLEVRTSVMSIWPNEPSLPKGLSDHYGVCVTIPNAEHSNGVGAPERLWDHDAARAAHV